MGLISAIITAPVAPVRFVGWTAQQVLDAAEQELYDPARIRRRLTELAERFDGGELSEEEFDELEDELLDQWEEAVRFQGLRQGHRGEVPWAPR